MTCGPTHEQCPEYIAVLTLPPSYLEGKVG